jgi:hypothetical protein
MSLEMIKRKAGMNVLYWRLKNSLDEIKEKHPEREDIIKPMEESLNEVSETILYFNHCDLMLRANNSRIYQIELENMKLKQEITSLNSHLKTLLSGEI